MSLTVEPLRRTPRVPEVSGVCETLPIWQTGSRASAPAEVRQAAASPAPSGAAGINKAVAAKAAADLAMAPRLCGSVT